jgi:membrane associated rhomboid family serine protease
MLLLPIGTKDRTVRRRPIVSWTLIAINMLAFLALLPGWRDSERETAGLVRELADYASDRPYLSFPSGLLKRLGPHFAQVLEAEREERSRPGARVEPGVAAAEQRELNRLCEGVSRALDNLPTGRFGFVPAKPTALRALTGMFVHSGWLHLLGNMLFLYICGPLLEDVYGRPVMAGLYLLSGLVATGTHAALGPQSQVPLVGASGAIAGVMGAFLIRLGASEVEFVLLPIPVLPMIRVRLFFPAFVVLPLWLVEQVWQGAQVGVDSGVAWWAHVGGFGFGAVVALALKLSGVEATWIRESVERKTDKIAPHVRIAREARLKHDLVSARRELQEALEADPQNVDAWLEAYEVELSARDPGEVGDTGAELLEVCARRNETAIAAKVATDRRWRMLSGVPHRFVLAAAATLERQRQADAALELYRRVIEESPEDVAALRALLRCGNILRQLGEDDEARVAYERARAHPGCTDQWQTTVELALAQLSRRTL